MTKAKRKAKKVVPVPVEELNAVEKGIVDVQEKIDSLWEKLKRWYRKP